MSAVSTAIVKLGKVTTWIPLWLAEAEQHADTVFKVPERLPPILRTRLQKERTDLETEKVLYREGRTIMTYFSKETEKSEKINSELMVFLLDKNLELHFY